MRSFLLLATHITALLHLSPCSSKWPLLPTLPYTTSPVPSPPLPDFPSRYLSLSDIISYIPLTAFSKKEVNSKKPRTLLCPLFHPRHLEQCLEHNGHPVNIFKLTTTFRIDGRYPRAPQCCSPGFLDGSCLPDRSQPLPCTDGHTPTCGLVTNRWPRVGGGNLPPLPCFLF